MGTSAGSKKQHFFVTIIDLLRKFIFILTQNRAKMVFFRNSWGPRAILR
jgi:hypothetical protein